MNQESRLNIDGLNKALHQLAKSLEFCNSNLAKNNDELFAQFRAAAIQAFEFTYELSFKLMKRFLELNAPTPDIKIDEYGYKQLLRIAAETGLIRDVERWFDYRTARNKTSHTYFEQIADDVYKTLPNFFEDANDLYIELKKRLNNKHDKFTG